MREDDLPTAFIKILDPLGDPAFLLDRSDRIVATNRAARQWLSGDSRDPPQHDTSAGKRIHERVRSRTDGDLDVFLRSCRRSSVPVPFALSPLDLDAPDTPNAPPGPRASSHQASSHHKSDRGLECQGLRIDEHYTLLLLRQLQPTLRSRFRALDEELTRAHGLARSLFDERMRAQRTARRFLTTLDHLNDAVLSTDSAFRIDFTNMATRRLLNTVETPYGEALQRSVDLRHPSTGARADLEHSDAAQFEHDTWQFDPPGQERRFLRLVRRPLEHSSERPGWLFVLRDITREHLGTTRLAFEATHDTLTGLYNRAQFERLIGEQIQATLLIGEREREFASVLLIINIDRFHRINDNFGHAAGDQLLIRIAQGLKDELRSSDILARLGGDEFGILFPRLRPQDSSALAQRVQTALRQCVTDWNGTPLTLTSSIGALVLDHRCRSVVDALRRGGIARRQANRSGVDQIHWFDHEDAQSQSEDADFGVLARLQNAMARGRLVLHIQAITPLGTELASMHEVLVRLDDADGFAMPSQFLPVAENNGLMPEIDLYVLHNAIRLLTDPPRPDTREVPGPSDVLSVNLSPQTLNDSESIARLEALIGKHPGIASRLVLEITETSALRSPQQVQDLITRLARCGVRFALDDFGAGYSSFQYLRHLGVHIIKIDGQFIRKLAVDRIDQSIVRAMVDIGHSLDKLVVAECVEDDASRRQLEHLGADYIQGYVVEKPHPVPGFRCEPAPPADDSHRGAAPID